MCICASSEPYKLCEILENRRQVAVVSTAVNQSRESDDIITLFLIWRAELVLLCFSVSLSDHTPVRCAASHLIKDVDMNIKDDLDKEKKRTETMY